MSASELYSLCAFATKPMAPDNLRYNASVRPSFMQFHYVPIIVSQLNFRE